MVETMLAMQLDAPHGALRPVSGPIPDPGPQDLLVEVLACGVCRTEG